MNLLGFEAQLREEIRTQKMKRSVNEDLDYVFSPSTAYMVHVQARCMSHKWPDEGASRKTGFWTAHIGAE